MKRGDGRRMARYTVRDLESGRSLRKHLYAKTESVARALLIEALEARRRGWLSVRPGRGASLQEYAYAGWRPARAASDPGRSIATGSCWRGTCCRGWARCRSPAGATPGERGHARGAEARALGADLQLHPGDLASHALRSTAGQPGRNAAALVRPFADQREERSLSVLSPRRRGSFWTQRRRTGRGRSAIRRSGFGFIGIRTPGTTKLGAPKEVLVGREEMRFGASRCRTGGRNSEPPQSMPGTLRLYLAISGGASSGRRIVS